jgi:hypothetical protein
MRMRWCEYGRGGGDEGGGLRRRCLLFAGSQAAIQCLPAFRIGCPCYVVHKAGPPQAREGEVDALRRLAIMASPSCFFLVAAHRPPNEG